MSVGHSVVLAVGRQWATEEEIDLSQEDQERLEKELGSWQQERVRLRWFRGTEEDRVAQVRKAQSRTTDQDVPWRLRRWPEGSFRSVQSRLEGRLGGGRG